MTSIDDRFFEIADRLIAEREDEVDPLEIDLDKVVEIVRGELPGVQCYVEQTGGGTATIYLGKEYLLDHQGNVLPADWPVDSPDLAEICIPVSAGPGWFNGHGWTKGRAHRDDFWVGCDCNDKRTSGDYEGNWMVEGPVESLVASIMVKHYREHPRVKAGEIE